VISLILFPVMGGLITTSPEFFHLLLNENWWPGIPYFQLFCVSAFFTPLTYLTLNIIKAKGASRTVLKLEVIKKSFLLAVVAITANINVTAMVYGYVVWMAFEMVANIVASEKFIKYSFSEIARDSLPYLGMTIIMTACVAGVGLILPDIPLWVLLTVKIIVGVIVYVAMNLLFRLPAYNDALEISKSLFKRKRKQ
jgi:teichuronic acid exporter